MSDGIKRCRCHYRSIRNYKYRLEEPYAHQTEFRPDETIEVGDGWLKLLEDGLICFEPGYAWDGASGPTIDTPNWMCASLVHDGLYQLLREGLLQQVPIDKDHGLTNKRKAADQLMHRILRGDGMSRTRARTAYLAVRAFGSRAARQRKPKPLRCAP